MERYSVISTKTKREMVLLKGYPCIYGKCSFCNYIEDNTTDVSKMRKANDMALSQIKGTYGVLEVVNSGSVFELDMKTLEHIRTICDTTGIHTLFFEAYILYMPRLQEIHDFFKNQTVHFRLGIETFDDDFRIKVLNKRFRLPLENVRKAYAGVLLLVCIQGQTKEQIQKDIEQARMHFHYVTISVYAENTTPVRRDETLVSWFVNEIAPLYEKDDRMEILIDNKDLGVYVQ